MAGRRYRGVENETGANCQWNGGNLHKWNASAARIATSVRQISNPWIGDRIENAGERSNRPHDGDNSQNGQPLRDKYSLSSINHGLIWLINIDKPIRNQSNKQCSTQLS